MNKLLLLLLCLFVFAGISYSQSTRYIVRFRHKGATTFSLANPVPYLSQRAIDRRTKYNIQIDSSDLPVPASFISEIQAIPNVTILNSSRWLNAITISTTDANAINSINALSYVQSTDGIAARPSNSDENKYKEEIMPLPEYYAKTQQVESDYFDYGTASYNEIHLHKGEFLHNIGLRGQGMQIAMLDGGFFQYTNYKAFDSANTNNQFLDTWDFVARESSVVEDNSHGMSCLSTIAANIPGQFIGMAPKAGFRLYRTEDVASENLIEEFNWACGAERADSAGADVISTSVGYNTFDNSSFDHTYSDMNGDNTLAAIAADAAAKKGLLVFCSAGNSGNDAWHYILTPADADSIIAVGAVNAAGTVGALSSYGPSFDGRIKPDVASVGVAALVQTSSNSVGTSNGTSFAGPKMAGLGTVLWQGFPEFNNMRIVRALKEAGSIYSTPDDRIGYGIPDMKVAFSSLLAEFATSSAVLNSCDVTVSWTSKDVAAMKYEIERKAPGETAYTKVGEMMPQNNDVLTNHSYQFVNSVSNISAGTVSYRIRQIIDTAAASFTAVYIDTASVVLSSACTVTSTNNPDLDSAIFRVSPNPVTNADALLVIQTRNAVQKMPVAIFDMNGKLVMQLQQSKGPGKVIIPVPVARLSEGKYIIKVYDGKKMIGTARLLKL